MTLQEAKDQAAKEYGFKGWWEISFDVYTREESVWTRVSHIMYEAGKKEQHELYASALAKALKEAETYRKALEDISTATPDACMGYYNDWIMLKEIARGGACKAMSSMYT